VFSTVSSRFEFKSAVGEDFLLSARQLVPGSPRFFWCAFVGMPILFVGTAICMFAFLGALTRYQAAEVAPVGKDTFNYLAKSTKEGVQTVATAVGAGLSSGMAGTGQKIHCPKCGQLGGADAKFCAKCGGKLTVCLLAKR
jgi:hypothetical protein